jgi:transcriptional regulator with XRE-family HTH domain
VSNVGQSIKAALKKKGKSQKWLAEQINVTNPYICAVCSGKFGISIQRYQEIADILDMPLSELVALGEGSGND